MRWMADHRWADLLAERNVISETHLERCRPFISAYDPRKCRSLVHAFHQTFLVTITKSTISYIHFYVFGEESMVPLTIRGLSAFRKYFKEKVGHGIKSMFKITFWYDPES
ncbi:hypothetical protein MPER_10892 [Moniliophthora perniciosa FA553]|nr:hypothetical protein MPER_10892 [Moniliophthora perniciosa FA553]